MEAPAPQSESLQQQAPQPPPLAGGSQQSSQPQAPPQQESQPPADAVSTISPVTAEKQSPAQSQQPETHSAQREVVGAGSQLDDKLVQAVQQLAAGTGDSDLNQKRPSSTDSTESSSLGAVQSTAPKINDALRATYVNLVKDIVDIARIASLKRTINPTMKGEKVAVPSYFLSEPIVDRVLKAVLCNENYKYGFHQLNSHEELKKVRLTTDGYFNHHYGRLV